MDTGNAACDRPNQPPHTLVANVHVVPRSADNPPVPTVGADAPTLSLCGATPSPITRDQTAGATYNGVAHVETS